MDNLKISFISALIAGSISGTSTWLTQDSRYGKQIESLSSLKTRSEELAKNQQREISTLILQLNEKDYMLSELQSKYSELEKKYLKCITSEGSTFTVPSFDLESHNDTLRTNDILDFRFTSTSVTIKIIRISDRGPIVAISGCKYFLTENETKSYSDGENCFLLKISSPLILKLSPLKCNEGFSQFKENELEQIILENLYFDYENQIVNLRYFRKVLF